jgi:hypothetical protein
MPILTVKVNKNSVTQPGVPKVAQRRIAFKISMIHKQICNSHYLSQFATFFIEPPTEGGWAGARQAARLAWFPPRRLPDAEGTSRATADRALLNVVL